MLRQTDHIYQSLISASSGCGGDGGDVLGDGVDLPGGLLLLPLTEEEVPRRQGILNIRPTSIHVY